MNKSKVSEPNCYNKLRSNRSFLKLNYEIFTSSLVLKVANMN